LGSIPSKHRYKPYILSLTLFALYQTYKHIDPRLIQVISFINKIHLPIPTRELIKGGNQVLFTNLIYIIVKSALVLTAMGKCKFNYVSQIIDN